MIKLAWEFLKRGEIKLNRIAMLRERMNTEELDAILVTSGFNRRYISGFTGSSAYLLITSDKAYLLTDFRYIQQAEEQAPEFEIIRHQGSLSEEVGKQLQKLKVHTIGFEKQHVTYATYEELQQRAANVKWVPIEGILEELRLIKTEQELATIQKACQIADDAFQHILGYIKPGVTEKEAAIELEFKMRKLGAQGPSFDTIIASGERGALPHGVASDKIIRSGELVTLDFGAYYQGYVSDITRTVAVGEPSEKMKEIYEIVRLAQENGVANVKPGLTGKQADALTRDLIRDAGYGEFFGHSTGHGIGLEVHEGPGLSSKSDVVLKPGMIVTVEPGIYLPHVGGVRIEDDVVLTDNGCEILTKSPKNLIIL
jgi:Xaa-Pro aminopeptidase